MILQPIHESNDCHTPAGSPAGGQFCRGPGGLSSYPVSDDIPNYTGRDLNDRISKIQDVPIRLLEPTETTAEQSVARMAQLMTDGEPLPAVLVGFSSENDAGEDTLFVIDGHTRLAAAQRLGYPDIPVRIVVTQDDWPRVKAAGGMKVNYK